MKWSTQKIDDLLKFVDRNGIMPRDNPFYNGDIRIRKPGIYFEYAPEELAELARIRLDIIHFAEQYCHVLTDEGIQKVKLRDYQKTTLLQLQKYNLNVWLASRQVGKTILSAIFNCWYLINNVDRNILLTSATGGKVKELMSKIEVILHRMPFFMKLGIEVDNTMSKVFDNGCKIVSETTTERTGASFTCHLLYSDEFALIQSQIINKFYRTIFPTLSGSDISRMIITSTPRGVNKFHEIWDGAIKSKNNFNPIRTDWWEVPGRDEQWRLNQIADLGSEEDFNQEFGNQFLASSSLLFQSAVLRRLKNIQSKFIHHDIEIFDDKGVDYEGMLAWHPLFNLDDLKKESSRFVISIDIGDGGGDSHSIVNIFQVVPMSQSEIDNLDIFSEEKDFFKLVQIGIFRDNQTSITDLAFFFYHLVVDVMNQENTKVVLERCKMN